MEVLSYFYRIAIVTARSNKIYRSTEKYLYDHGVYSWDILICSNEVVKEEIAKKLEFRFMVEDDLNFAEKVSVICPVYLIDYPWNRKGKDNDRIIRVNGWNEIVRIENVNRSRKNNNRGKRENSYRHWT
jgi:uncharacterized HAD superfamily protein